MKSRLKTSEEYQNFENALRHVVQVSRAEIQAKLEAEKKAKDSRRSTKSSKAPKK
jgi:hypothetical protein